MIQSIVPAARFFHSRLFRSISLLVVAAGLSSTVLAQADAPAAPGADAAGNGNGRQRRGQNGGNFDPAAMQERMMTALREQFGVADDAEWKLLSDRITAVSDLRRATAVGGGMGGMFGGRGGGGPGGGGRGGRGGAVANPEMDALRAAITDNLPDAEVKSRLDHLREVRKDNEAKLAKAQENLRAVLTVRQEAVAVMAGLLP